MILSDVSNASVSYQKSASLKELSAYLFAALVSQKLVDDACLRSSGGKHLNLRYWFIYLGTALPYAECTQVNRD